MIAVEVTNECLGFVSNHKKCKIKFKKAKYVSNRCNDLFKGKKCFGFRCTFTDTVFEPRRFSLLLFLLFYYPYSNFALAVLCHIKTVQNSYLTRK